MSFGEDGVSNRKKKINALLDKHEQLSGSRHYESWVTAAHPEGSGVLPADRLREPLHNRMRQWLWPYPNQSPGACFSRFGRRRASECRPSQSREPRGRKKGVLLRARSGLERRRVGRVSGEGLTQSNPASCAARPSSKVETSAMAEAPVGYGCSPQAQLQTRLGPTNREDGYPQCIPQLSCCCRI